MSKDWKEKSVLISECKSWSSKLRKTQKHIVEMRIKFDETISILTPLGRLSRYHSRWFNFRSWFKLFSISKKMQSLIFFLMHEYKDVFQVKKFNLHTTPKSISGTKTVQAKLLLMIYVPTLEHQVNWRMTIWKCSISKVVFCVSFVEWPYLKYLLRLSHL